MGSKRNEMNESTEVEANASILYCAKNEENGSEKKLVVNYYYYQSFGERTGHYYERNRRADRGQRRHEK